MPNLDAGLRTYFTMHFAVQARLLDFVESGHFFRVVCPRNQTRHTRVEFAPEVNMSGFINMSGTTKFPEMFVPTFR
jgi:hypothetical protein